MDGSGNEKTSSGYTFLTPFKIEKETTLNNLFNGLRDSEQHP